MALDKIQASGIGNNVVALHHCDWYSDATGLDAGGLKLPVGTTAERPIVILVPLASKISVPALSLS